MKDIDRTIACFNIITPVQYSTYTDDAYNTKSLLLKYEKKKKKKKP
jgi:hypothetical protein